MKPVDLRNDTWESLQGRLTHSRRAALAAWQRHGPGTTRAVALKAGESILHFRPRSTELFQLGLLALTGRIANEGVYEAVPEAVARAAFERAKANAGQEAHQLSMRL